MRAAWRTVWALAAALVVSGCPILVEDNYSIGEMTPFPSEGGPGPDAPNDARSAPDASPESGVDATPETSIPDGAGPPDANGCANGTRDGKETDIDCGGPDCKSRIPATMRFGGDCASLVCKTSLRRADVRRRRKNGDEVGRLTARVRWPGQPCIRLATAHERLPIRRVPYRILQ
jgi:hypothetical protein